MASGPRRLAAFESVMRSLGRVRGGWKSNQRAKREIAMQLPWRGHFIPPPVASIVRSARKDFPKVER